MKQETILRGAKLIEEINNLQSQYDLYYLLQRDSAKISFPSSATERMEFDITLLPEGMVQDIRNKLADYIFNKLTKAQKELDELTD